MKLICANVCITFMKCFTLEKKYRHNHSFVEQAHANKYIVAARGNATSFPLFWLDVLQQLQAGDTPEELRDLIALPRVGEDFANIVLVLLKTADATDSDKDLARLIHQATVRRDVVVKLIASMKREVARLVTERHASRL